MLTEPLGVAALLAANVVLAEWLAAATWLRHLGSALLVIVTTAICANVGLMPTFGEGSPVYDGVFEFLAPLGIFWLLLGVSLRDLKQAGLPMLVLFLFGALGTMAGVYAGMGVVGGSSAFGDWYPALGGMFVGTYVGGSINFNAIALEYHVNNNAVLYAGANLVDSAMTTVWMAACVFLPRALATIWPAPRRASTPAASMVSGSHGDRETVHPKDLALLVALGSLAVLVSNESTTYLEHEHGIEIPKMIFLTTIALVLAQLGFVQRLRGGRLLGMFAVLVFLAVIGALCDVAALRAAGPLGVSLCLFVLVTVAVHGLVVFVAAAALRMDPALASVASQANIGGGTSALALARSLRRGDLVLPAILMGSLGTALGNYLGFWTVELLQ